MTYILLLFIILLLLYCLYNYNYYLNNYHIESFDIEKYKEIMKNNDKKNLYKMHMDLAEDQELLLRTMVDSKFYSLPSVLLAYRKRSKFSFYKNLKKRISLLKSQLKYFFINKKIIFSILAINLFFFKLMIDLIKLITFFLKTDLIKNRKKKYEINNNFNNLVNFLKK